MTTPYLPADMDAATGIIGFNEQILQSQRPNFFELLAQEAMHEALRPAFQYMCKVREEREREIRQTDKDTEIV